MDRRTVSYLGIAAFWAFVLWLGFGRSKAADAVRAMVRGDYWD
jgi:hypothetical protein